MVDQSALIDNLSKRPPAIRARLAAVYFLRLASGLLEDTAKLKKRSDRSEYSDKGQLALLLFKALMLGMNMPDLTDRPYFQAPINVPQSKISLSFRGFIISDSDTMFEVARTDAAGVHAGTKRRNTLKTGFTGDPVLDAVEKIYKSYDVETPEFWSSHFPVDMSFVERDPSFWRNQKWEFWLKWLRSLSDGALVPLELQRAVLGLEDEIWASGPVLVAEEIARIEAEYLASSVAEKIEFSESGRLSLVSQQMREAHHLGYLLETVVDALDLAVAGSNELNEQSYQARLIRQTLSRYANDPQRIEINFERAKVSLIEGIAAEDLPASPANRDLIQSLSDVAGSIRESNPDVARNRERLNRIRLDEIRDDHAQRIAEVTEEVAEYADALLKVELQEGTRRLPGVRRDDPVPDPVIPFPTAERNVALELKDSRVLLFSRLSKTWLYLNSFDRKELSRIMDTPEAKLMGLIGSLASIVALIVSLSIF